VAQPHTGTVTFLFTDIEGSTRLLQELGDGYAELAADHRRIMRQSMDAYGGREVDSQGDSFFVSFSQARAAVSAAVAAQRALAAHPWPHGSRVRVRMGLHTGEPQVADEGYVGIDVVRAARIAAAGHGGQILISETTRALLGNAIPDDVSIRDLGSQNLKDVQHERIYELALAEEPNAFPPLRTADAISLRPKALTDRLDERVNAYVEQQLEAAFTAALPGTGEPGRAEEDVPRRTWGKRVRGLLRRP